MEGQGPGSGTPRLVGLMMGSANAYALDKAEYTIMGYGSVPLIATAEKERPGIADAECTLLKPEDLIIEDYRRIGSGKKGTFRSLIIQTILNFFHRSTFAQYPGNDLERSKFQSFSIGLPVKGVARKIQTCHGQSFFIHRFCI